MINAVKNWYDRHFTRDESVILFMILLGALLLLSVLGDVLMPVFVALVLAYLMQGVANQLQKWGLSREFALTGSTLIFVGVFFGFSLGVAPLAWRQFEGLIREAPAMMAAVQVQIEQIMARYPLVIEQAPITKCFRRSRGRSRPWGRRSLGLV